MRRPISGFIVVLFLVSLLYVIQTVQAATLTVSPSALQGWQIIPDGTVPYTFTDTTGSIGTGSLQFGPIDGSNPVNQFILQAPYLNGLSSEFSSFAYDIYVDPLSTKGSQNFLVQVYVNSSANGPGTTLSGYDCRYDFATPAGLSTGTWHTRSFDANFTGWVSMSQPIGVGACQTSLNALPANSTIMFIRLNGGGSTVADEGLMGGFDNVVITTTSGSDTYDFETDPVIDPAPTATSLSPVSVPLHTLDDRINNLDAAAPVAVYGTQNGQGLVIYEIDANGNGFAVLAVSPAEIAAVPFSPASNMLIAQTTTARLSISFWRLASGEFQLNVTQPNGKTYVLIFTELVAGGGSYTSQET